MITYLLSTVLLSCLGALTYRYFLRKARNPRGQRISIYVILLASLVLPALYSMSPDKSVTHRPAAYFGPTSSHMLIPWRTLPPEEAKKLRQLCQCEAPNYTHRLTYSGNIFYQTLIENSLGLNVLLWMLVVGIIVKGGLQMAYLQHLIRTSRKEIIEVLGHTCILLFPTKSIGFGAFRLRHRYILWQQEMEGLTSSEKQAILAHEYSHLRQGNTWEKSGLQLLQCIWFFNPAFYFFRKELEWLSECIADDVAVEAMGSRKSYARLLVRLEEQKSISYISGLAQSQLKARIERLLNPQPVVSTFHVLTKATMCMAFQFAFIHPVTPQLQGYVEGIKTYAEVYPPETGNPTSETVYCLDCETVCLPCPDTIDP